MTKILVVGDIHVSDKPPINCTESYTDDIIEILHYVAGLEKRYGVDAVVWAGDVFDHKAPSKNSHALVLKMIAVVRAYRSLWIVPGNHDISNDRLDSIHEKQPLGVLYAAGANELSGWHPELPLYGAPWQQDWEANLENAFIPWLMDPWRFEPDLDDINKMRPRDNCLAVTHATIFPPSMAEGVPYANLPAADVAKAMGNSGSLYYGHIHDYHGVFEEGGVTFANVGAVSRGSLTESHTTREVKVVLWTDEGFYGSDEIGDYGFDPGFNEIVVPHKPASEVFRIQEGLDKKNQRLNMEQFLARVGSSTLAMSSTAAVVEHIRSRDDVSAAVKARSVEFLEDAEGA